MNSNDWSAFCGLKHLFKKYYGCHSDTHDGLQWNLELVLRPSVEPRILPDLQNNSRRFQNNSRTPLTPQVELVFYTCRNRAYFTEFIIRTGVGFELLYQLFHFDWFAFQIQHEWWMLAGELLPLLLGSFLLSSALLTQATEQLCLHTHKQTDLWRCETHLPTCFSALKHPQLYDVVK